MQQLVHTRSSNRTETVAALCCCLFHLPISLSICDPMCGPQLSHCHHACPIVSVWLCKQGKGKVSREAVCIFWMLQYAHEKKGCSSYIKIQIKWNKKDVYTYIKCLIIVAQTHIYVQIVRDIHLKSTYMCYMFLLCLFRWAIVETWALIERDQTAQLNESWSVSEMLKWIVIIISWLAWKSKTCSSPITYLHIEGTVKCSTV